MNNTIFSFLQEKLSFLSRNPIVYFLLAICTLLGAFWGKKGLSKKRISFRSVSFPIIRKSTNAISNVSILYKNKSVTNLTITNFIIWNSSDKSIRKEDIVPLSPLHFSTKNINTEILDLSIIETNNPTNNAYINLTENEFSFSFDYLKKKNGVVIQVIHTGYDDDIKFTGELIDGNLKCENLSSFPILKILAKTSSPKITKIMDTISLICICITLLFIAILSSMAIAYTSFSIATLVCLFIILFIFFFYFLIYKIYFTVPRSLSSYLTLNK